jgi:hypothetical protein
MRDVLRYDLRNEDVCLGSWLHGTITAKVHADGIMRIEEEEPPDGIAPWIRHFQRHESVRNYEMEGHGHGRFHVDDGLKAPLHPPPLHNAGAVAQEDAEHRPRPRFAVDAETASDVGGSAGNAGRGTVTLGETNGQKSLHQLRLPAPSPCPGAESISDPLSAAAFCIAQQKTLRTEEVAQKMVRAHDWLQRHGTIFVDRLCCSDVAHTWIDDVQSWLQFFLTPWTHPWRAMTVKPLNVA